MGLVGERGKFFTHIFQICYLLEIYILPKYYFIYSQLVSIHPTIYIVVYIVLGGYSPRQMFTDAHELLRKYIKLCVSALYFGLTIM